MKKLYCMSDIHGCYREFQRRLEQLGDLQTVKNGGDALILLGDYIDGGPESGKVLRSIFGLQAAYGREKIVVLRGNHEEMLLEWLDAYTGPGAGQPDEYGQLPWSGWLDSDGDLETFRSLVTEAQWAFFQQVMPALSEDSLNLTAAEMVLENNRELIEWLRQLPWFYETEGQIFVHAGIDEEAGDRWREGTLERTFVWKYPPAFGRFSKDIIAGHVATAGISGDRAFHDIVWDGQSHYYIDGTVLRSGQIPVLVCDTETGRYYSLGPDTPPPHPHGAVRGELRPILPMKRGKLT